MQLTPYIKEAHLQNLRDYKYKGGDAGYFYIYFMSPLAQAIVNRLPRWLA